MASVVDNSYIPLALNVRDRRVIVVGGGRGALIKLRSLLSAGARVIIVAPEVIAEIRQLVSEKSVRWWKKTFEPSHLNGALLVAAVTGDVTVNRFIIRTARIAGVTAVASGSNICSRFSFCAAYRAGPLLVGISTSKVAPAFAGFLKSHLKKVLPQQWGTVTKAMGIVRSKLDRSGVSLENKRKFWRLLFQGPAVECLLQGRKREYEDEVRKCFFLLQG